MVVQGLAGVVLSTVYLGVGPIKPVIEGHEELAKGQSCISMYFFG